MFEDSKGKFIPINERTDDIVTPLTKEEEHALKSMQEKYQTRRVKFTVEELAFIKDKLSNKLWRLNNLYWIRNKDGQLQKLTLNYSQNKVLEAKHNKKIILKSRQQGISTLYLAYNLDECIFNPGYNAGIQSYGLDESQKLQMRAELMWDKLDKNIIALLGLKLVMNNSKGMAFNNGSILKIGNFRGDTLQGLHVSELAKIALKSPEKARELKTGAFQAVSTKNKITIESTGEGPSGLFFEIWTQAERNIKLGKPLTPLDFLPVFLPWMDDPDCTLDFEVEMTPETQAYIDELTAELEEDGKKLKLTPQQISWLIAKQKELGTDFDQEYPATPQRAFKRVTEGAYFKEEYQRLIVQKRITKVKYDPTLPLYVAMDLGVNDMYTMIFGQPTDTEIRIVDEYYNTGKGFSHYAEVLKALAKKKGYKYTRFFLPHDVKVQELGTGQTRLETLQQMGFNNILVLKRLPFVDSINIAKSLIDMAVIDENCKMTIESIQLYRRKFDAKLGVFLETDVHNEYSNFAAGLRYLGQGLKTKLNIVRKVKIKKQKQERNGHSYKKYKQNKPKSYKII